MRLILRSAAKCLIALAVSGTICGSAAATDLVNRTANFKITGLSDPSNLNNASTQYDNVITLGGSSAPFDLEVFLKSGANNVYFNAGGGGTTTLAAPAPGTTQTFGQITTTNGAGTFGFGYETNNGPNFSSSWTDSEILNGYNVLHFEGANFGGASGSFTENVILQGNWSTSGGATGDYLLANINPLFTVTSDFVYDPITDLTTFSAFDANYLGGTPAVDLYLFGAAVQTTVQGDPTGPLIPDPLPGVPEPATWAQMLIGVAAVGAMLRMARRQSRFALGPA